MKEKKLPLAATETNWYLFNLLYRYFGLFLGLVWATILYLQNLERQTSFVLFAAIAGLIVFNFFNTRFLTRKNHPLVRDILSFAFNLASISLLVYTTGGYLSSLWVMYLIPLMALSLTANSSQIYIGIAAASILQSLFYFHFLFFSNPYQGTLLIKIGIFVIVGTAFKKAADLERGARHQEMKKNEELSRIKEQLIQSEKMSVLGEVISGFTHELSNPLTAVVSFSQIIERAPVEERDKILLQIKENALRCKKIIENLVTFTRSYKSEKRLCSINKCLETVLKIREYELKLSNIELIRQYDRDIYLMVDENKLQQAFFNLLNNAHQALSACNKPAKQISVKTGIKEGRIIIEFSDTGEGIPKEILPKIFNPFFTTKEKNTGLGLSVSYGIIKEHGGNIFAQNNPSGGAQFIIELPITRE
ncbi:MAG: HAMP domain-containing sensor histidine kinase [Elusimicrobiota bacterium]